MPSRLHGLKLLLLALVVTIGTGCVRAYHPLSGLHRPVVVDIREQNLKGVGITAHCVPEKGGYLNRTSATALCTKVTTLLQNQGAVVKTITTFGRNPEDLLDDAIPIEGDNVAPVDTNIVLELRAKKIHASNHPISWLACLASFTVLPGIVETTFSQEVQVRDSNGFLLEKESLQGRMVTRFGAGAWVGNMLLDRVWRKKGDKVIGYSITRDMSRDLYRQISQLTYNAKTQAKLLAEASPAPPPAPKKEE